MVALLGYIRPGREPNAAERFAKARRPNRGESFGCRQAVAANRSVQGLW
jgi:hypothetical protein